MTGGADAARNEAIRQLVALVPVAVLLVAVNPRVQIWVRHQVWRAQQARAGKAEREEILVAAFRRELSEWLAHGDREVGET